jgi:predicted nucleic acid-binding protein
VILLDTSGLLAAIDSSQTHHRAAASALRQAEAPRYLSLVVLAELDDLLATRGSRPAEQALLGQVAVGV